MFYSKGSIFRSAPLEATLSVAGNSDGVMSTELHTRSFEEDEEERPSLEHCHSMPEVFHDEMEIRRTGSGSLLMARKKSEEVQETHRRERVTELSALYELSDELDVSLKKLETVEPMNRRQLPKYRARVCATNSRSIFREQARASRKNENAKGDINARRYRNKERRSQKTRRIPLMPKENVQEEESAKQTGSELPTTDVRTAGYRASNGRIYHVEILC